MYLPLFSLIGIGLFLFGLGFFMGFIYGQNAKDDGYDDVLEPLIKKKERLTLCSLGG